jgi:hypothetical protein
VHGSAAVKGKGHWWPPAIAIIMQQQQQRAGDAAKVIIKHITRAVRSVWRSDWGGAGRERRASRYARELQPHVVEAVFSSGTCTAKH